MKEERRAVKFEFQMPSGAPEIPTWSYLGSSAHLCDLNQTHRHAHRPSI